MNSSVKLLRAARKWHKRVSTILFAFFFIISATGVLLGWKSLFASKIYSSGHSPMIHQKQPWLPMDSLLAFAKADLRDKVPGDSIDEIVSLNAFPDKNLIRVSFRNQYNVQLNAVSGELISIEKKATDLIVKIHDGEWFDDMVNSKNEVIKTTYTSIMGLALFFLTLSGFWMRFMPKRAPGKSKENTQATE